MRFDGQGVFAQQAARHPVVDHGLHGFGAVVGLAVADDAVLGVDAQQEQAGEEVFGLQGLDGGDFDFALVEGGGRQVGFGGRYPILVNSSRESWRSIKAFLI